jgi:hypothetical protein
VRDHKQRSWDDLPWAEHRVILTEMVTSGSMSGEGKRTDGLLGESDTERRRSYLAPPVLYATALVFDSTDHSLSIATRIVAGVARV